jgi:hypothetical protein
MNAKKIIQKKPATKKPSRTSVAVKRTKATKEAKPRATVQFSTQVLDLPMIPRSHHEALNFIHRNVMPPFGKLSKNIDIKNTMFKNALGEHFGKHPDPDGEGTYVFQRRGDEVLVYQIVPGRADSAFVLKVDTVRRGPKTIEYFAGVREADAKERNQAIQVGLGVDAKMIEATAPAETVSNENLTIPNIFHKPWPQAYEVLRAHITIPAVNDKLLQAVRQMTVHVWRRGTESTDDLMNQLDCVVQTQVGIATTDSSAQGSVDLQLFVGARAGAIPVGVVHLTTKRNAGGYDEIVEVMPELTVSAPLGGGHPQRRGTPSGVWDNSGRQQPLRTMPPMVGIGEPRAAWGADMTEPFGRPDQGGLSPYGKAPGLYGQRPSPSYPGGYPEKTIFTTNSLSRFSAYIGMMMEDELLPMARASADQVLLQLNTNFRNAGAGVMSFVAEYAPGKALVFQVRNGYGEVIFAQPIFLS